MPTTEKNKVACLISRKRLRYIAVALEGLSFRGVRGRGINAYSTKHAVQDLISEAGLDIPRKAYSTTPPQTKS